MPNGIVEWTQVADALQGDIGKNTPATGTRFDSEGLQKALNFDAQQYNDRLNRIKKPATIDLETGIEIGPRKEGTFLEKALTLINLWTPNIPQDVKQKASMLLTGGEYLARNPVDLAEAFFKEEARYQVTEKQIPQIVGGEIIMVDNPHYSPDPKIQQEKTQKIEGRLHELYKGLADSRQDIQQKYVKAGMVDPKDIGFWDEQAFSIGMNLPFLLVGGGAARLGATGISLATRMAGYPLFTLMEAGSHAGDVYRTTAKVDAEGRVIPNSGDLHKARKSLPFGLLAGTLEFWGVSQSIGFMSKLATTQLKNLGFGTALKEVGKIAVIEGGEEVTQDLVEQYDMYLQGLQPNIDLSQTAHAGLAGTVGGLLMGGFSFGTSMFQLQDLKAHAEKVPKIVDKLVQAGQISREKAKAMKNVAKEVLSTDIETLNKVVGKLAEVGAQVDELIKENNKQALEQVLPAHVTRAADALSALQKESQKKQVKVTTPEGPLSEQRANLKQVLKDKEVAATLPVVDTATLARIDKQKALHETIAIANTLGQVREIEDPNILDYTTLYGRSQAIAGLNAMSQLSEDRDFVAGFLEDNFVATASKEALHEVNVDIVNDLMLDITERGLTKILHFVPTNDAKLKQDVAIGIALNFDEVAWEFVRSNNPHIDSAQMDGIIEQAEKLQTSEIKFTPLKTGSKKLGEEQNIASVQKSAKQKFVVGNRKNIGVLRAEVQDIVGAEADIEANGVVPPQNFPDIQISEAISYHVGTKNDEDYVDSDDLWSSTEDMMQERDPVMAAFSQSYRDSFKDTDTGWRPYAAALFNKETGVVLEGRPNETHYDVGKRFGVSFLHYIDGFVDVKGGKFMSRTDVAKKSGVAPETIVLGIVDIETYGKAYFELSPGLIPDIKVRLPRYSEVLNGFSEWCKNKSILSNTNTFGIMYRYLVDTSSIDEHTQEVMIKLLPFVENRKFEILTLDAGIKGLTNPTTLESAINENAIMERSTDVWNTFIHEASHSYLTGFLRTGTQAAETVKGQIKGVMNIVSQLLNSDVKSEFFKDHWLGTPDEFNTFRETNKGFLRDTFFKSQIGKEESREDYLLRIENEGFDEVLQSRRIDEFITSIWSDTQRIKWLADRTRVGGKKSTKPLTGWKKIKRAISNAFSKAGMTQTASDKVFDIMEQFDVYVQMYNTKFNARGQGPIFNSSTLLEHNRLNRAIHSGYDDYSANENEDDQFDEDQNFDDTDEEDRLENKSINNFASFLADLNNMPEVNYREMLRELGKNEGYYEKYLSKIQELNEANKNIIDRKLQRVYRNYKKNFATFDDFKTTYLKRQFLNLTQQEAKEVAIFIGNRTFNPETFKVEFTADIRRVKGRYPDGKNTMRNTYRHNIRLEAFIPKLETLLGLPTGTLEMVYLDSFETSQDGVVTDRANIERVQPYTLDVDGSSYTGDKTALLAEVLWRYESNRISNKSYLYMGTFQGKNTLPMLSFPSIHKALVKASLEHYEQVYLPQVLKVFGEHVTEEKSEGARMGAVVSMLLEDLWHNAKFEIDESTGKTHIESIAATQDRIKAMSRGKKFLVRDTGVVLNKAEFESRFGTKTFTGVSYQGDTVITTSAVFDSNDEGMFTFQYRGHSKTVSLKEILRNQFGTVKTDGATFYIIGEFDNIYQWAHGNLKSGALKNLLSSRFGTKELFIKHAMFGVHKDSMLGQIMLSYGLTLLHSDEAVKIPKDISLKLSEFQGQKLPKDNLLKIDIKDWERIKEEQTTNPLAGNFKQLIGGIGFGDYNPVVKVVADKLKVSADKILANVVKNIKSEAEDWFVEHNTPEVLAELLQDIVNNPQSPAEFSVSKIIDDKLTPKEGQTLEDILTQYSGIFQHAHIAEVLRNRLKYKLDEMLRGRTAGGRSTVGPNIGWANHQADIDPVMTKYAISNLILNMKDTPSEILHAAFPEKGLIPLLKDLAETQRIESRAHSYFFGAVLSAKTKEQQERRQDIFDRIRSLGSPRIEKIMQGGIGVGIEELVNWENVDVQRYQDKLIWGTEYKNNEGNVVRAQNGILKQDGSLQRRFAILTEEDASTKGLRPGDRFLAVVTPLSGGMDLGIFTLAGVAPNQGKGRMVTNNGIAKFNSEWLQTIVGKDFDIDTISIIGFDDRYWSTKDWNDFADIIEGTMDEYPKQMAETIQKLFRDKEIIPKNEAGEEIPVTKDTIFTHPEIRRYIGQAVNGKSTTAQRTSWAPMGGSWIQADSAFLDNSIATAVAGRKIQGMYSSIGLKADKVSIAIMSMAGMIKKTAQVTDQKGATTEAPMLVNFNSRHDDWMLTHVVGWAETHDRVDYPKDINIQYYNSDTRSSIYKSRKLEQNWGLFNDVVFQELTRKYKGNKASQIPGGWGQFKNFAVALNAWTNLMFGDALQLSAGRSPETYTNLTYDQTVNQIRIAQAKLDMFARNDKEALKAEYKKFTDKLILELKKKYNDKKPKYLEKETLINSNAFFINSFIDGLSVENVYNYPPFEMVRNINPDIIPVPGDTYKDHLINQVLATTSQVAKYPDIHKAYLDQQRHTDQGSIFRVPTTVADKIGKEIFFLLGQPKAVEGGSPDVQGLLDRPNYLREKAEGLPSNKRQQLQDLLIEWKTLHATAGQPYKPLVKIDGRILEDGKTEDLIVNVDEEVIILGRMVWSMDYRHGRQSATEEVRKTDEYWRQQLKLVREEASSLMHAYGENADYRAALDKVGNKKKTSDTTIILRKAHESAFPLLWKALLDNPFLFFPPHATKAQLFLKHETKDTITKEPINLSPGGDGQLWIEDGYKNRWNHNDLRELAAKGNKEAKRIYDALTKRNGLWEGVLDNGIGSYNRYTVNSLVQLGRNIPMQNREALLIEFLNKKLYGSTTTFTRNDQLTFWLSLLAQPTDQGMRDNKGLGFIVNRAKFDPKNPYQFQNNHLILSAMASFEPDLLDDWLRDYNHAQQSLEDKPDQAVLDTIRFGKDGLMFELAPPLDTEHTLRHFMSDYIHEYEKLSKDNDFKTFYKEMRSKDWKHGLKKLRTLVNSTIMLKALSENGVYYEDIVLDIKRLSEAEFHKKYSHVDGQHIRLTLERYLGDETADTWIYQNAGESEIDWRARGNVISLFWVLNGVQKREKVKDKHLTWWRKLSNNIIGYDTVALLSEKQTHAVTMRDEALGVFFDPKEGAVPFTSGQVTDSMRPFATRGFQGTGNSTVLIVKGKELARGLKAQRVEMNDHAKRAEDMAMLLSSKNERKAWGRKFATHIYKRQGITSFFQKRSAEMVVTEKNSFISRLLDQISTHSNVVPELRREQVWKLAENMQKTSKIEVKEKTDGSIFYRLEVGKGYAFQSVQDLIASHFSTAKPDEKLALIAALEYRVLFDIKVPKYIQNMITYLEANREDLKKSGNLGEALSINAMVLKYRDMLQAITMQKGNYMPHQFPESHYKQMWAKDYLKAMVYKIQLQVVAAKRSGITNKYSNLDIYSPKDKLTINKMAMELVERRWTEMSAGWNQGKIIANFLPRKMPDAQGYTRTDPTTIFNYISKLSTAMQSDALKADWLVYQKNARETGERTYIMEITKRWMASQAADPDLYSEPISKDKIKPGMRVSFAMSVPVVETGQSLPYITDAIISGVVRSTTKDTVTLDYDKEKVLFDIKNDMRRYEGIMMKELSTGSDKKPSTREYIMLQKLLNTKFLTTADLKDLDLAKMNKGDINGFIFLGLSNMLKHPEKIGVYNKSEIFAHNVKGTTDMNSVNRHIKFGGIDRLLGKARELKTLRLFDGQYDDIMTRAQYYFFATTGNVLSKTVTGIRTAAHAIFLGLASQFKARFFNQTGATINNLIDAPKFNLQRTAEAWAKWDSIKHGNLDLMMNDADRDLYKAIVGLGLAGDGDMIAIALEEAQLNAEDVYVRGGTLKAAKALRKVWSDAIQYKPFKEKFEALQQSFQLESDPIKRMQIELKLRLLQQEWEAKVNKVLSMQGSYTEQEIKDAWKKVEAMAITDKAINLSQEQGIGLGMATIMMGKVALKKFYTGSFGGIGFQAKAEKMRIPAFFIGYYQAIEAGFDHHQAIQFGANSIELRHALYGTSNRQLGAATTAGKLAHQFAQYQYNAAAKALRIISEAIPQMLKVAHSRGENTSRLQHLGKMMKLVIPTLDAKGEQMTKGDKHLSEINLAHVILNKVIFSSIQMQIGTRILYGLTNVADPIAQSIYHMIDFLIDTLSGELGGDDEDDKMRVAFLLNDILLLHGMGYKLAINTAINSTTEEGALGGLYKGRANDTEDFLDRAFNDMQQIMFDLDIMETEPTKAQKSFFDPKYLVDDFFTGIKLVGWTPADATSTVYVRKGGRFGLNDEWPYIMKQEETLAKTYGGGRYVDTGGKGIDGLLNPRGRGDWRGSYLFSPASYIPFLDRITNRKP